MGENSHTPLAKIAKTFHKPLPNLFQFTIHSYSLLFFLILSYSHSLLSLFTAEVVVVDFNCEDNGRGEAGYGVGDDEGPVDRVTEKPCTMKNTAPSPISRNVGSAMASVSRVRIV